MVCRLFQYHTHGTEMLDELDEKMIYYFGDMEMNSGNKHETRVIFKYDLCGLLFEL